MRPGGVDADALYEHLEAPRAPQRVLRRGGSGERRAERPEQANPPSATAAASEPVGRGGEQPLDPDHLHERGGDRRTPAGA